MSSSVQLLLPLVVILVGARLAGMLSQRGRLPAVFGELLVGLVLGPTLLNWIQIDEALHVFAEIGVILLLFLAGLETDLVEMRRVGKSAFLTATGGVILPFIAGFGLATAFGYSWLNAMFAGTILTATSVSISTQVLSELGQLKSRMGMTVLGAAVIDDVLGILVLSIVLSFSGGEAPAMAMLQMIGYLVVAFMAGRLVLPYVTRWIHRHHAPEVGLALILAIVLVYAWSAEALGGLAAVTGAYVIGVMLGQVAEVKEWVTKGASHLGYGFFVPIFFVAVGLQMKPAGLGAMPVFTVLLVLVAIITKIVGCGLGVIVSGRSLREAVTVGCGMVGRGEVALVMATVGLASGRIDDTLFAATILMTVITTLVTPIVLKMSIARLMEPVTRPTEVTDNLMDGTEVRSGTEVMAPSAR